MKNATRLSFSSLFFLFITLAMFSCGGKKKSEIIARQWKATELNLAGTTLSAEDMGGIYYHFKADGTFEYTEAGKTEEGTWKMNEEGSMLTLQYEDQRTADKEIKELSETTLILEGEEHGMNRGVTMVPAN